MPSTMNNLRTSWLRPQSLTTDRFGSWPIRAVPSRASQPDGIGALTVIVAGAGRLRISDPARERVIEHLPRVFTEPIGDFRCRDAV